MKTDREQNRQIHVAPIITKAERREERRLKQALSNPAIDEDWDEFDTGMLESGARRLHKRDLR